MNWPAEDTIRKVRVRYTGPEREARTPALQLRLERLLRGLDWRPRGMKPGAVLLIRRLTGLPALDGSGTLSADWERALQDRLQTLYERALRPRGGIIPADADSILFEDEAELLLQLTHELSLSAPAIPRGWYWQQIQHPADAASSAALLSSLWTQYISVIPAVFNSLPPERIIQYARLLPPDDAETLIEALSHAFRMPSLTRQLRSEPDRQIDSPADERSPRRMPPPARRPQHIAKRPSRPPWPFRLPAVAQELAPPAQVFIAWALTLRRAPALARHPDFAQQVGQWLDAMRESPDREQGISRSSLSINTQSAPDSAPSAPTAKTAHRQRATPESEPHTEFIPLPEAVDGIWTRLGGVLFLYHVLRWLNLPHVWDARISAWAAIETLACALLGGRYFPDDPVWAMLAALDNREPGARIGENITETLRFSLPFVWLEHYGHTLESIPTTDNWPTDADNWIAPQAAEWLRGALPVIRALLAAAIAEPQIEPEALAGAVLLKGGRISISNTHIDLYLHTDAADTRLRRAGLDLDPGWVPDLGYIVLFHYTE